MASYMAARPPPLPNLVYSWPWQGSASSARAFRHAGGAELAHVLVKSRIGVGKGAPLRIAANRGPVPRSIRSVSRSGKLIPPASLRSRGYSRSRWRSFLGLPGAIGQGENGKVAQFVALGSPAILICDVEGNRRVRNAF